MAISRRRLLYSLMGLKHMVKKNKKKQLVDVGYTQNEMDFSPFMEYADSLLRVSVTADRMLNRGGLYAHP